MSTVPPATFAVYRALVFADVYRYGGKAGWKTVWRHYWRGESFRYVFWLRTCAWTRQHRWLRWLLYFPLARGRLRHYRYRFGIGIPCNTRIGPGLFIGHFGAIVVNERAEIGSNCNLSQQVTIGQVNRGSRRGIPAIGDHVYIAPGAKIVGGIKVGNRVAIGANAVVTKDIEDDAVVGGVPARVLSHDGVEGYVEHTDYTDAWWFTRAFPATPAVVREWPQSNLKQGT